MVLPGGRSTSRPHGRRTVWGNQVATGALVVLALVTAVLAWQALRHVSTPPPSRPASSPAGDSPSPTAPAAPVKTVFVGDSVTRGPSSATSGAAGNRSWIYDTLGAGAPWSYQANVAAAGLPTGVLARRFQTAVLARHPDGVVILGGSQDLRLRVPTAATVRHLRSMVTAAQQAGVKVWLVSPLPSNARPLAARKLHKAEAAYAAKSGVPFLDTFPALSAPGGRFRPGSSLDGRHPTPLAARKLARSILAQASPA